jgi:hypothetical protein
MHATRDISKILKEYGAKADIVMCMNASYWVLKKVARKGARVYVATCSDLERARRDFELYMVFDIHIKLYACKDIVVFSTANASTSNLVEVSLVLERDKRVDKAVRRIEEKLKNRGFYKGGFLEILDL